MMASELDSLPADLEDGEIDELSTVDSRDEFGSKRHSKRKLSDESVMSSKSKSKAKKAKIKKSKDSNKSSRRKTSSKKYQYEDLDQSQPLPPPQLRAQSSISNFSEYACGSTVEESLDYSTEDEYHKEDDDLQGPEDFNVAIQEGRQPTNDERQLSRRAKGSSAGQRLQLKRSSLPKLASKNRKPFKPAPVHETPVCSFYMEGRCNKGENCPFSHAVQPLKKPLLCKFYALSGCNKSSSDCPFMHSEFPCKFHHLRGYCRNGQECRFSHQPLSSEMRVALLEHVATCDKQHQDAAIETQGEAPSADDASETGVLHQQTEPERQVSLLGPAPKKPPRQLHPDQKDEEHEVQEESEEHQPHFDEQPLKLQQQPFRQMLFPPRPFPHPSSDAENRNAPHQLTPPHLQPPTHQQHRLPFLPPSSVSGSSSLLQRPAYCGPEPPARPFPSAPPRGQQPPPQQQPPPPLPPPPSPPRPTKPTPVAVAAASRALDAVASLLSEYCSSYTFGAVGEPAARDDDSAASPGTASAEFESSDCKAGGVEDSQPVKLQKDSDSDEEKLSAKSQQPVLVFRPPPVCKRRLPWRIMPLDSIERLPYSLMPMPRSVLTGSCARNDPRLAARLQQLQQPNRTASVFDPRINQQQQQQPPPPETEASKSGTSSRLQLNERSAASATTGGRAVAPPGQQPGQRAVFDPRFRRRASQQGGQ